MSHIDAAKLRHPLYLDISMMVSFLATIEDGVAYDANIQRQAGTGGKASAEAQGQLGLPSLLGLLPFDLRGRLAGEVAGQESEVVQLVRRHTEASLFNQLRNELVNAKAVKQVTGVSVDFSKIAVSDLIEVSGHVMRNPLAEILAFFGRVFPMLQPTSSGPQSKSMRKGQSMPAPARTTTEQDFGFRAMQWVKEDLENANTQDVLLKVSPSRSYVLTLGRDFGTGKQLDDLLGARLTVLGKVSDIIEEGSGINLLRRSVLGPIGDVKKSLLELAKTSEIDLGLAEADVPGPTLQLLPLAIFV